MTSLENLINDYIQFLDNLYQEKHIIEGIDETPLSLSIPKKHMDGLLYYGSGILTDKFFIKNVVVSPSFKKEGDIYCLGDIEIGDYVTTCNIYGVARKAPCEDVAFGKVVNIKNTVYEYETFEQCNIRKINVEFLQ